MKLASLKISRYSLTNKRFGSFIRAVAAMVCIFMLAGGVTSCKSHKSVKGHRDLGEAPVEETIRIGKGDKTGKRIVEEALTWLGTPYRYAGAEKGEGTDCSGMVMKVYETTTGCKIPRNSAKQAEYCESVEPDKASSGDLVFFATGKDIRKVSHVGIVINEEDFIHASSSKGVVVSKIHSPYFEKRLKMFGRVPH